MQLLRAGPRRTLRVVRGRLEILADRVRVNGVETRLAALNDLACEHGCLSWNNEAHPTCLTVQGGFAFHPRDDALTRLVFELLRALKQNDAARTGEVREQLLRIHDAERMARALFVMLCAATPIVTGHVTEHATAAVLCLAALIVGTTLALMFARPRWRARHFMRSHHISLC